MSTSPACSCSVCVVVRRVLEEADRHAARIETAQPAGAVDERRVVAGIAVGQHAPWRQHGVKDRGVFGLDRAAGQAALTVRIVSAGVPSIGLRAEQALDLRRQQRRGRPLARDVADGKPEAAIGPLVKSKKSPPIDRDGNEVPIAS